MSIDELETAALNLAPKDRARLAERLLDSLEQLSAEENARLWAEEAQRRSDAIDAGSLSSRSAEDVFRDARARL
jgi:putative addiction module component (TIGR02574 family)